MHWGDGNSNTYSHRRRQEPHLRRRPDDHRSPSTCRRGRHLPRPANALSVHVVQRRPDRAPERPDTSTRARRTPTRFTVTDPGVDTFTVNTPAYPDCGTGGNYVAGSLATTWAAAASTAPSRTGRRRPTSRSGSPTPTAPPTPTPRTWSSSRSPTSTRPSRYRPSPVDEGSTHTYSYTTTDDDTPAFTRRPQLRRRTSQAPPSARAPAGSFDCTYADGRLAQPERDRPDATAAPTTRPRSRLERRPDDRDQRRSERQRGLALQPDPGRSHRPGHRHRLQLHRPLGRRQLGHLLDERRQEATPTPTAPPTTRSRSTWSTRTAPSSTARTRISVHVNNVAPSIAISGAANVNEGSAYSLTLGAVTDPGTDTVSSYVVHWGDGSDDTYATNGAKSHTYADGAARPPDHGRPGRRGRHLPRPANALSVHVNNVAPSIAISGATERQRRLGLHA